MAEEKPGVEITMEITMTTNNRSMSRFDAYLMILGASAIGISAAYVASLINNAAGPVIMLILSAIYVAYAIKFVGWWSRIAYTCHEGGVP
jgi:hypothetical protein